MAPRNTRVNPTTEVRSPARSFAQSLDNFYAPKGRDTRADAALQNGINAFSGILGEQAAQAKADQREGEFSQGVQDALREQAGEELKGVKTGSLFRQNSRFYMAGLNETRGKAAAARFKSDTALAYEQWEGRHVDDDGTLFREWMNDRVSRFMGDLGDDQYKVAGALPAVTEIANNIAAQHTGYTSNRLEQESFEAYDEIVSGVFSDLNRGDIDMETAVLRIADEADDMYTTDGAKATDNVVQAAIRYANIHNDPDSILTLAQAHDAGKLKLSQVNRERLANAMDAVEADMARQESKRSAQETAEAKALKTETLNEWGRQLAENPYVELPAFGEINDQQTYRDMVTLQDAFIKGSTVDNPAVSNIQRMQLEADLFGASSMAERIRILSEFTQENPDALGGADVSKYTKEIFETADPGSLINDPTVGKYRSGFGQSLGEFQKDEYDLTSASFLKTAGERHFNDYMLAQSGKVDMQDPAAIRAAIKEAEAYAMEQLAFDFPEVLRERNESSPLGGQLGVDEALETRDTQVAQEAAAKYAELAGQPAPEAAPEAPVEPEAPEVAPEVPDVPLEEQETPYDDAENEVEYSPTRAGFYGEIIQRFTDGEDSRPDGQSMIDLAGDVLQADPEFAVEVDKLANELNIQPGALMAVMHFETGGTFSTTVKNAAGSGATGLIQFMPKTARSLGTSVEELSTMSRSQQMTYVRKYLKQFPAIQGGSVDDVYMAVLWPAAVGKPDGYPIFRAGTIAYKQNRGLDTNGDGQVTKFEAAAKVKARFHGY